MTFTAETAHFFSEVDMKLLELFQPSKEIYDHLSFKDQKKVKSMIIGDMVCTVIFALFALCLALSGRPLLAPLMVIPIASFSIPLFLMKKGRIKNSSYISSLGLMIACTIIAFFTSHCENPVVSYRTVCFCEGLAVMNYFLAIEKKQITVFNIFSVILLYSSTIFLYHDIMNQNMIKWIINMVLPTFGIEATNILLALSMRSTNNIVEHSEKEHETVAKQLETITRVFSQVKESINVGQKINGAADSASRSVDRIKELYLSLSQATEDLEKQTQAVKDASEIVDAQSVSMKETLINQNNSLNEMSAAVTEISSNISSIDRIAEKRREGMDQVTRLLDEQLKIITSLVDKVKLVKESSQGIQQFVQTVDSIAGQTSLLAMNASIEAAHSGEYGKGFSVIAQEIRKLSEETTANANKISDTLKDNNVLVEETADSAMKAAKVTKDSTQEIKDTVTSMEEILRGIHEMDAGTKDVMNSVSTIVEQSESSTGMINEVVMQISAQSDEIANITSSTDGVKERVNSIAEMLSTISTAMKEVHQAAKENEEVSEKLSQFIEK